MRNTGLVLAPLLAALLVACSSEGAVRSTPTIRYTPIPTPSPSPVALPSPAAAASTPAPPNYDEQPLPATDLAPLTQQLVMVEAAIRDPKVTGKQLAWIGHLQQLVYSQLQEFPEWREPALAALAEPARSSVAGSLDAGKQLRMLATGPIPKTLPDWKIVDPAPMEDLLAFYKEAEAQFGIGWYYLASIHLVETRMGRIHGLSIAGAQGPMQFMPSTWAAYGKGDINDNHDAILGAARYLRAAGAPDDMQKALFAYNHSEFYVKALATYAQVMKADPAAYRGYYGWQVYYPTKDGPILLPVGWTKP